MTGENMKRRSLMEKFRFVIAAAGGGARGGAGGGGGGGSGESHGLGRHKRAAGGGRDGCDRRAGAIPLRRPRFLLGRRRLERPGLVLVRLRLSARLWLGRSGRLEQ